MNIEIFQLIIFLCMSYIILGDGFVFDTNIPKALVQGQSTVDESYSTLMELLMDEKKHRFQLEQRIDALEKQTGCKEQTAKLEQRIQELEKQTGCREQTMKTEQLSIIVLELEKKIKQIEMQNEYEVSSKKTINSFEHTRISNVSDFIENGFQTLIHKDDTLLHKQQATEKTIADLQRNESDLVALNGIDQVQLLETLRKRVDSVERKSNMIMNTAKTREQDYFALYNQTKFFETNLENKISNIGNTLMMTWNMQIRNLSYELERKNNISATNWSTRIAKKETSIQNMVKKLNTEWRKQHQKVNASLLQLNSRLDIAHQDLIAATHVLESRSKKVALTTCVKASSIYYTGQVIPFQQIRSIIGINQTTQFLPNGTFICDDTGLYIITITLATQHGSWMSIFKNGKQIMDFFDSTSNGVDTATGVVTTVLKKNDRVYVKSYSNTFLYEPYSCLTIVKVM